MRFKNFSAEPILYEAKQTVWTFPKDRSSRIDIVEKAFVEAGEVTEDFDPDDPIVQLMLKAHPELRPIVTLSRWEWLRRPAF